MLPRLLVLGAMLSTAGSESLAAQRVLRVELVQAGNSFRFDPARVTARAGDVLEFTVKSGGPYVIGFEPSDLTPLQRERLDAAFPARTGPLRGPLLTGPGKSFQITLPELPQGSYRFLSTTHRSYRMEGLLVVR